MNKKILFLTDITLHIRDFRTTVNFGKVAQKGRLYTETNYTEISKINSSFNNQDPKSKPGMNIIWPEDLAESIEKGDIILMMPEDGLPIIAGDDMSEKFAREEKKKRNISKRRGGTWHSK